LNKTVESLKASRPSKAKVPLPPSIPFLLPLLLLKCAIQLKLLFMFVPISPNENEKSPCAAPPSGEMPTESKKQEK
jgi:hypothetical protein